MGTAWALAAVLAGCGSEPPAPAAEAPPAPAAPAPAEPAPATAPAASEGPNPCDRPEPVQLELSAGVTTETPWGLEITYTVGEKNEAGQPSYDFLLRHGERRWPTARSWGNWNKLDTWRGFCWRGADRPEARAPRVKIDVAPVCDGKKLVEMGGCRDALQ